MSSTTNGHSATDAEKLSAREQLAKYKERINGEALKLLQEEFPKRIMQLDDLYNSPLLAKSESCRVHTNVPIPPAEGQQQQTPNDNFVVTDRIQDCNILMLPNGGIVESNENIIKLQGLIKPIILQLSQDCNTLRLWIQFLIPKVEDGNNFGVGIQEECLEDVNAIEKDSMTYLEQISRYLAARGALVSKLCKYPHIGDYRQAITELDEKQFHTVRICVSQLRNDYTVIYDILMKNLEKIQRPRNSNTQNLY